MQKAILYIRVSTDRQAEQGFSLPAQETALRQYCKNKNIEVVALFQDDYSAKDGFDRPGYNKLKSFIGANKDKIDYLFITQWSRFSRVAMAAFGEYYDLKERGIIVNAIEQPIDISIPENLVMASVYFAIPQVENERLSLRTIAGMRQAIKQGRYIYTPPKGYKSNKLTKDIEIDERIANIVNWGFNEYSKGIYSAEEIRKQAYSKGLSLTKQAFLNMLANKTYLGKVYLKEYKNEPAQWLNGIHEPIIDSDTFNRVQRILANKRKPYKQSEDNIKNALPLRGHLICPNCNRILTGSTPKGNGGRYPYYHCQQVKYGCKCRFSAKNAHNILESYLKDFQPTGEVIELSSMVLADIYNSNSKERFKEKDNIEREIETIKKRINTLSDAFADDKMPFMEYNETIKRYREKENNLAMQHITITKVPADFNNYIKYSMGLFQNLSYYYTNASAFTQNKLIGLIFPEKLTFTGTEYKTTKTNEFFNLLCNVDKGLQKNSPAKIARLYSEAPPSGLEPETL